MPSIPPPDNVTAPAPAEAALTLLLVEDDLVSREMLILKLKRLFTHIDVAENGAQGLQLFLDHAPDIILSDQIMPGLSGLDMFQRIRAIDPDIATILMTSYMDNDVLLKAINLGVNRFIPKPFNHEVLTRVLTELMREVTDKRQLEQCRQQELSLLRYRDHYNSMQQQEARRKERHVARHDLRCSTIPGAEDVRWGITVTKAPRDIMCGDGYTIRSLPDGRQFVFVVDAMGSGLSASLSALLSTSFCNYLVEHLHHRFTVSLTPLIKRFLEYLDGIMLEEEVLSCGFFLIDLMSCTFEMALCGLPPLLVRRVDGSTRRVPGTNPPLSVSTTAVMTTTLSLDDIADVMVMTDGITDASLSEWSTYRERLEDDFKASPTLTALLRQFRSHTADGDRDDLTLLHLQRLDLPAAWNWHRKLEGTGQVAGTIQEFFEAITGEVALKHEERCDLEMLLNEGLSNALAQTRLSRPSPEAEVALSASLWRGAGHPLLTIEIRDNGPGLSPQRFRSAPEGSGLSKIRRHCDCAYIGSPGCHLLLLKTIERGETHAH